MKNNLVKGFIITTFVSLYLVVSIISTIHVIEFFKLSNPNWLAVSLAIAFEIGAAASLASLIALDKMNRGLVWILFITLTAMQMMGNTYYAFTNLENYQGWIELFGLVDEEPIYQKRILSIISGAILPLVALGFIKSLVDYIRPSEDTPEITENENAEPLKTEADKVWKKVDELRKEGKLSKPSKEDNEDEPTALANSQYRNEFDEEFDEEFDDLETASLIDLQNHSEFNLPKDEEDKNSDAFFGQHLPEDSQPDDIDSQEAIEEKNEEINNLEVLDDEDSSDEKKKD
jgi:hypothetical protein